MMFEEAFFWSVDELCEELMDMGVDDDLVRECGGKRELLAGLYIYSLLESELHMTD